MLNLLLVPPGARDHRLGCGDSTEGTVRTPAPSLSPPDRRAFHLRAQGHTKPEEEVGTMESAIRSWGLVEGEIPQ